jgi:predicted DNA-binding protein with PD1-like motif
VTEKIEEARNMLTAPIGEVKQISKQAAGVRAVAGRLLPRTDLVAGVKAICREHGVKNGFIVSCIGSLNYARFVWATPDPLLPAGFRYADPTVVAGPVEFVAAQGTIGVLKDTGELSVHMHIVVTDDNGVTWSGHLQDEGNPVCLTMEIAILAFDGIEIVRELDSESGMTLFGVK